MATAKEVLDNDTDNENLFESEPPTNKKPPKAVVPKPAKGEKVNVRTQITYQADLENDEKKEKAKPIIEAQNAPIHTPIFGAPVMPRFVRPNTLAALADTLSEDSEDTGEQTYIALIERLADNFNETYNRPCLSTQNFPPMQFSVNGMLLSFIPAVQKFNGNSGGRFNIKVCRLNGEAIDDAELNGFCIANPVIEDNGNGNPANGNVDIVMSMFKEMQTQNDRNMAMIVEAIKGGKEKDRFSELAEKVLMDKLLNGDKQNSFSADEMIAKIFTTQAMIETFSEKFRESFGGKNEDNRSTFEKFIDSDAGKAVAERGLDVVGKLATALPLMLNQKAMQATPQLPAQPQPQPLPQATPNPAQAETTDDMQELIADIFEELESDNPLNDDNEFLQELIKDYPLEYQFVKMLAKENDFQQLVEMLHGKAPELFVNVFTQVDMNGTPALAPTEYGARILGRLAQLYYHLRGEQPPVESGITPATPTASDNS